jgi:CRISPR system Cascade subunit CasC
MKKLIEAHVLQNFAPSNLNRDDMGAPKDALFGGSRRARISSQCQKRAMRRMFAGGSLLDRDDLGLRTKRLVAEIEGILAEAGRPAGEARKIIRAALAEGGLAVDDDGKTEYLLFLGRREIREFARVVNENWDSLAARSETTRKEKTKQPGSAAGKALGKILNGGTTPEKEKDE